MKHLFEEFPSVSKAEWLEKIKKDLKGKAISDFDWQLGSGLSVSAFPHSSDLDELPHPIAEGENRWQIGEDIKVENIAEANKMALRALEGGAEALRFVLISEMDFNELLSGIDLSIISIHFVWRDLDVVKNPEKIEALLRNLSAYAIANGLDTAQLNGTLNTPLGHLSIGGALRFALENLPNFKVLPIHGFDYFTTEDKTTEELTHFNNGIFYWQDALAKDGFSMTEIYRQIHFTVAISKNYFLQIAKLRALRQRWAFMQEMANVQNPQPAFISAFFPMAQQSSDANSNLIQATTQAMSAVIGGVDVLTVLPSDMTSDGDNPTDFSRRMARNVQHTLKMESHFDWVADPAAGSYFIEDLTAKLLEGMRFEMVWV